MNGAITEPLFSTTSPPNSTIMTRIALQLPFLKGSESMGNHDSEIVDADGVG